MKKNNVKINGFIDNSIEKQGTMVEEYSVISLSKVKKTATIVIASGIHWYAMKEQLYSNGYINSVFYEEIALFDSNYPVYNQSFEGLFDQLAQNKKEYIKLFDLLEDEKSRQILNEILEFRMSLDTCHTKKAFDMSKADGKQYFDTKIMKPRKDEVFIDGGGFNGDTVLDFIEWSKGEYQKIIFFEPDKKLFDIAKDKLKAYKNIEYRNMGLGKEKGMLFFDSTAAVQGGGKISDTGDTQVEIDTLDTNQEKITFLKLDVEGAEYEILQGGRKTIESQRPTLAISVYHKAEDLFYLTDYIRKIAPEYKFYLRHYTETYADTVLIAMAK